MYDQCCNNQPVARMTYDCGNGETDTWLVCEYHLSDPEKEFFQRHVVKKEMIQQVPVEAVS